MRCKALRSYHCDGAELSRRPFSVVQSKQRGRRYLDAVFRFPRAFRFLAWRWISSHLPSFDSTERGFFIREIKSFLSLWVRAAARNPDSGEGDGGRSGGARRKVPGTEQPREEAAASALPGGAAGNGRGQCGATSFGRIIEYPALGGSRQDHRENAAVVQAFAFLKKIIVINVIIVVVGLGAALGRCTLCAGRPWAGGSEPTHPSPDPPPPGLSEPSSPAQPLGCPSPPLALRFRGGMGAS